MTRIANALTAVLLFAAGCVRDADPLNHPCPCSHGLVCCAASGLCVKPDAGFCPSGADAGDDSGARDAADAGLVYQRWISSDPAVELKIWRAANGTVTGTFRMGVRAQPLAPATEADSCYPPENGWYTNDPADGGTGTTEGDASPDLGKQICSQPKEVPLEGWDYSIRNGTVGFVASGARDQLTFGIDRFEYFGSWCGLQLYNGTTECLPDCDTTLQYCEFDPGQCDCHNGTRVVNCTQQMLCCPRIRHFDYVQSDRICVCDSTGCRANTGGPDAIFLMKDGRATGGLRVGGDFPVAQRFANLELQQVE